MERVLKCYSVFLVSWMAFAIRGVIGFGEFRTTTEDLVRLTSTACTVAIVGPNFDRRLAQIVAHLSETAFKPSANHALVHFEWLHVNDLDSDSFVRIETKYGSQVREGDLLVVEKRQPDRTCLLSHQLKHVALNGVF